MTRLIDQGEARRPTRFGERLEGREGQILDAAFRCIVEKGIAATSTHAVAARAGLSQGVIHYYFRSKDAMLARVLENLFANSSENIRRVAAGGRAPSEKLAGVLALGASLVGPRKDELIVFFAFWAHAMAVGGRWRARYQELFRDFRETIVAILEEGEWRAAAGGDDTVTLASLIVAVVQGLGLQVAMDPDVFDAGRLETILDSLFNVLVAPQG